MDNEFKQFSKEEFLEGHRNLSPFELYQLVYKTRLIVLRNESVLSELEDEALKEANSYYSSPILEAVKGFCQDTGLNEQITFNDSTFSFSFVLLDVKISASIVVHLQMQELKFDWVLRYNTTKDVSRAYINKIKKLFDEKLQAPGIIKGKLPSSSWGPANDNFTLCRFSSQEEIINNITENLVALLK